MDNVLNVAIMQTPESLIGLQDRIDWLKRAIDEFNDCTVDLLVLPELYLTGYNVGSPA